MAKKPGSSPQAMKARASKTAAAIAPASALATPEKAKKRTNPVQFAQEVRQETNKVTWPSRKETGITTAMVFIFAAISAVFFLLADQVIRFVVTLVLGVGG